MEIRLHKSQEIEEYIEESCIDLLDYFPRGGTYRKTYDTSSITGRNTYNEVIERLKKYDYLSSLDF